MNFDQFTAGRHFLTEQVAGRWTAVFARVSTGEQVKEGGSLHQQITAGIASASRDGVEATVAYIDPGKSASKLTFDQRAGIRILLQDVRQGSIGVLYLYKRDRVARQSGEWLHFWKTCRKHGVEIRFTCPQEPPIGKGIYGKVQEAFMSLWAELESEQIRTRVKDSILSRFQNGEWVGGALPFGLCRTPEGIVTIHDDEGPLVREIFRMAHDDGLGPRSISQRLNETRPLSRRGLAWTRDAVSHILQNRTYCGYLRLKTTVEEGDHEQTFAAEVRSQSLPALVSEEVWNTLAQRRRQRQRRKGSTPTRFDDSPNLLAGLLTCSECGGPLVARHRQRRYTRQDGSAVVYRSQAYYCQNAKRGPTCSAKGGLAKEALEVVVLQECYAHLRNVPSEVLHRVVKTYVDMQAAAARSGVAALRRRIAQTEAALQRNRLGFERSAKGPEGGFYEARITELLLMLKAQAEQLHQAECRLSVLQAMMHEDIPLPDDSSVFNQILGEASPDVKRALLAYSLDDVSCGCKDQSVGVRFLCEPDASLQSPRKAEPA